MSNIYLWIKALHVLAVISWMAGMLYLPRLFVYHAEAAPGSPTAETFEVMERRLMRAIMLPAMLVAWASGLTLAVQGDFFSAGWLHGKLLLVILMSAIHGYFARIRRDFAEGKNRHPSRFYRVINEIPTILMIGIVLLVIVKPF
jgi:putative membrane protein